MAKSVILHDVPTNETIYPVTLTSFVMNSESKTLEQILNELQIMLSWSNYD